jgi:predicted RNA-binding Zn ribbon-like protein
VGFYFVSERLCLDFVNTEIVDAGTRVDLLQSFGDLAAWAAEAGIISHAEAKAMSTRWKGDRDADRALQHAREFRASLRAMCERIVDRERRPQASPHSPHVPQRAIDDINAVLCTRVAQLELVRTKTGYDTQLQRDFSTPAQLLVPIAESAADLLSRDDLSMLKKCQGPQCIIFFYDTTKNHRRRWCSMAACGNRAKVAAHYHRTRGD